MRPLLVLLERLWEFSIAIVTSLMMLAAVFGLPLWLLYLFVAPFFGPEPMSHLSKVVSGVAVFAAVMGGLYLVLRVASALHQRFRVVRVAANGLLLAFLALIVLSALVQCTGGSSHCTPNRYFDC